MTNLTPAHPLLDPGFWHVFILGVIFIFACLTTFTTGATPLFWLSLLFACLEAGLRQAAETVAVAGRHYWTRYPKMLRKVREEVAQRAGAGTGRTA